MASIPDTSTCFHTARTRNVGAKLESSAGTRAKVRTTKVKAHQLVNYAHSTATCSTILQGRHTYTKPLKDTTLLPGRAAQKNAPQDAGEDEMHQMLTACVEAGIEWLSREKRCPETFPESLRGRKRHVVRKLLFLLQSLRWPDWPMVYRQIVQDLPHRHRHHLYCAISRTNSVGTPHFPALPNRARGVGLLASMARWRTSTTSVTSLLKSLGKTCQVKWSLFSWRIGSSVDLLCQEMRDACCVNSVHSARAALLWNYHSDSQGEPG